ncbi:MAG: LamG domain-containing protein [Candidatus Firestonebacteria bacterium]
MPTKLQKVSERFKSCVKINPNQTGTVSCGNNSGFDLTSEITIEAWVKLGFNADRASTTYETIVAKSDANTSGKLNYWLYLYGKRLGFQFKKTDLTVFSLEVDSGDAIPVGQWVHVAATFKDSTDEIKLYIDNVLKKSRTDADGTPGTTTNDVTIGKMKIGTTNYCYEILGNSCIDEVRISDIVRTSFDITAPLSSDGNTIALYHFDEGSGTVADNAQGTASRDASVPEGWWAQEVDENSIMSDNELFAYGQICRVGSQGPIDNANNWNAIAFTRSDNLKNITTDLDKIKVTYAGKYRIQYWISAVHPSNSGVIKGRIVLVSTGEELIGSFSIAGYTGSGNYGMLDRDIIVELAANNEIRLQVAGNYNNMYVNVPGESPAPTYAVVAILTIEKIGE